MGILKDKVALVTGSSRGIGAAVAKIFAREGAKVAIHGRDETALSRVAKEIECTGGHVTLVVADVTKFAQIEAARRQIERELGPVELLVANAGVASQAPARSRMRRVVDHTRDHRSPIPWPKQVSSY
jgi:3-oxoacyl-[acyl-carrier protein] reductase